jgi:hypothetical protein
MMTLTLMLSLHVLLPLPPANTAAAFSTAAQCHLTASPPNATVTPPPSHNTISTHVDCCVLILSLKTPGCTK